MSNVWSYVRKYTVVLHALGLPDGNRSMGEGHRPGSGVTFKGPRRCGSWQAIWLAVRYWMPHAWWEQSMYFLSQSDIQVCLIMTRHQTRPFTIENHMIHHCHRALPYRGSRPQRNITKINVQRKITAFNYLRLIFVTDITFQLYTFHFHVSIWHLPLIKVMSAVGSNFCRGDSCKESPWQNLLQTAKVFKPDASHFDHSQAVRISCQRWIIFIQGVKLIWQSSSHHSCSSI